MFKCFVLSMQLVFRGIHKHVIVQLIKKLSEGEAISEFIHIILNIEIIILVSLNHMT